MCVCMCVEMPKGSTEVGWLDDRGGAITELSAEAYVSHSRNCTGLPDPHHGQRSRTHNLDSKTEKKTSCSHCYCIVDKAVLEPEVV
jgi:hypothetical protein